MAEIHTEHTFEATIVDSLVNTGGYRQTNAEDYSRQLGLFKYEVIRFLQNSQPTAWKKSETIHGENVDNRIIQRLFKELDLRGTLDVLRKGFKDFGVQYNMVYLPPESTLNPDYAALYAHNQLTVTRQLRYSLKHEKSLDLLLCVNGLPIATAELKNHFTGQNRQHAQRQYMNDRDARELLFEFKKRALVHFAVDQDEVYMTTRLNGSKTKFLPFNRGDNGGAGNPSTEGYKTAYLWREVWQKDSWLDIIGRYIHLQTEEVLDKGTGKTYVKEKMIFPRYHQLNAVRALSVDAKIHGAGKNYLIQHSAGSGKSNSIAWLAYRLSSLHNGQNNKVFDSVIVVTDRRVLDQQLQNTIFQFDHKTGVVQRIDRDSAQLAYSLSSGKNIIITTLQKFPFVVEQVGDLPDRNYAVIIDEAHSSQGGEASRKMQDVLAAKSLEEATEMEQEEFPDEEDAVREAMTTRGPQPNLSFFAFTATPKQKTLEVFGVKGADDKPRPFHKYTMKQAIEEGFILNVLLNYTTYNTYFKLSKAIEEDPEFNKKKAAKAIGRFLQLHPHNITQKTEVIVEHFLQVVVKKIGGKAKAMLVTGSRLHAKRYYHEMLKYIESKGYDLGVLVAYSGKVVDDDYPDGVSEPELTGYGEKQLPEIFDGDDYRLLIVADKYQTGFDQPLLHTMYVDKVLSGVKAVQTLSRLNRIHLGKEDTFILDFANEREVILSAFQEYYEGTTLEETTDPNHLYDIKYKLDDMQVYWHSEVEEFAQVFFPSRNSLTPKNQDRLYGILAPAQERFNALSEENSDKFKKSLRTWTNLYSYLSQIMPFKDADLEKFYPFAKYLLTKLPRKETSEQLKLSDEVALEYYRLQKVAEGEIELESQGEHQLKGITDAGISKDKDEKALLSEIINLHNDRFGTNFNDADRLFFDQVEEELAGIEKLQLQAKSNSKANFKYGFKEELVNAMINRMDNNQDLFEKFMDNKEFGGAVFEYMLHKVYKRLTEVKEEKEE